MSIAGLDVGTSGSKIVVFSDSGRAIASASRAYEAVHDGTVSELDPRTVWEAVKTVIRQVSGECAADPIEAIAVTTLGEAGVPVDADGNILGRAILYNDPRGKDECARLVGLLGRDSIMGITGHPANEMYSISKLAWLKGHSPYFARMKRFLLFEDFIVWMMTGIAAISYSLASRTMAFDVVKKEWSKEIFAALGLDVGIMSAPSSPGSVVGVVRAALADELGLGRGVKIITGGHDQTCAALGGGILDGSVSVDGVGSCEVLSIFLERPRFDKFLQDGDYVCVPYVLKDTYLTYVNVITSGAMLQWFRREILRKTLTYEEMDALAGTEPSGLVVLPQFSVSPTPHFNFDARGTIWGFTLGTSIGQFYRALMEGATFQILYNLELLARNGISTGAINVTGGGGAAPLWLQIKADILGEPVRALKNSEAGATGCMMLAGVAIGKFRDLEEASAATLRCEGEYFPNSSRRERYMEIYEKYKKIYEAYQGI